LRELAQRVAVAEQPGIEKVWRQASRLGFELPEQQYPGVDGEADELVSETGSHGLNVQGEVRRIADCPQSENNENYNPESQRHTRCGA
jgi:hypothetical protein